MCAAVPPARRSRPSVHTAAAHGRPPHAPAKRLITRRRAQDHLHAWPPPRGHASAAFRHRPRPLASFAAAPRPASGPRSPRRPGFGLLPLFSSLTEQCSPRGALPSPFAIVFHARRSARPMLGVACASWLAAYMASLAGPQAGGLSSRSARLPASWGLSPAGRTPPRVSTEDTRSWRSFPSSSLCLTGCSLRPAAAAGTAHFLHPFPSFLVLAACPPWGTSGRPSVPLPQAPGLR